MQTYFKTIGNHKLLTHEQEVALCKRIEAGDKHARDEMVRSNLRLAISIAKKYQNMGVDFDDLIQESNIGLLKAVERFDYRRGFKFSTYATYWIKQSVIRHLHTQSGQLRLSSNISNILYKISRESKAFEEEFGQPPTNTELAELVGVDVNVINKVQAHRYRFVSLDSHKGQAPDLAHGGNSEFGRRLGDYIADERIDDPDDQIDQVKISALVREGLKSLTPREEKILRMRFGIMPTPEEDEMLTNMDPYKENS